MAGVWIIGETREQSLELLNAGGKLASQIGTTLAAFAWNDRALAEEYISRGADEVLLLPAIAEDNPLDAYIPVMADEARRGDPDVILVAATLRGKHMAASLASRLNTGLASECTALTYNEEHNEVEMERLAYGGAAVQKVVCTTRPAMATIPPRTFEAASQKSGSEGTIRELQDPPASPVTVLERKPKTREAKDITESRVIVCVGRGIEKEEDLALARDLANALGGEIGCTRPISEEMHWLPEELCIGLSGITVKPELYIGVGVSGQVQHITGIRDAKLICAINTDENAPIFDNADYGIVGDLYDVVPRLVNEVKKQTAP